MSFVIALTGKGGVGKTTTAALLVRSLIARGKRPVLAVDADPNSCLDLALGVESHGSIGQAREEAGEEARKGLGAGISKQELIQMKIAECLVEAEDFDYLAMGRPEGPGCYCYANNVLRQALGEIAAAYPYVVIDNEAGLENLSRRIVTEVDVLLMVTEPTRVGADTVLRLAELSREMEIKHRRLGVAVNRLRGPGLPEALAGILEKSGADFLLTLPYDEEIAGFSEAGRPLSGLSPTNKTALALAEFVSSLR